MTLKLFVVGESTPDPDKWSIWSEFVLVVAADEKQASDLAGSGHDEVSEVSMDTPQVLVRMSEPAWGDDL